MSKPTDAARNAAQFLRDEIPDPLDVVLDFGTREMVIEQRVREFIQKRGAGGVMIDRGTTALSRAPDIE